MAESPYSETIIAAIKTALEGITVQSGDNRTVSYVGRYDLVNSEEGERPAIVLRWLGEKKTLSGEDYNVSMSLEVQAKLDYDLYTEDSLDEQLNKLGFDVEVAIANVDYSALACTSPDLLTEPLSEIDPDDPVFGVNVRIDFAYAVSNTSLHDPEGPGAV